MQTNRTDFNETWLTESPSGLGDFELFDMLVYNIADLRKNGFIPTNLNNNLFKIELDTMIYYWYEANNVILLIVELEKKPLGLIVLAVAKNPTHRNKPPYATDAYLAILNDKKSSLRIISDKQLSNAGFSMWKRLYAAGNKVSVYDTSLPGGTFKTIDAAEDMNQYFQHDNTDYEKYRFILSPAGKVLGETRNHFHNRRYRELAKINTSD